MHAQNFVVDNGCDRQTIKTISEDFPQLNCMAALTFIVKPIDAVNGRTLMITSQKEKVFWVLDFVSQKKAHGF